MDNSRLSFFVESSRMRDSDSNYSLTAQTSNHDYHRNGNKAYNKYYEDVKQKRYYFEGNQDRQSHDHEVEIYERNQRVRTSISVKKNRSVTDEMLDSVDQIIDTQSNLYRSLLGPTPDETLISGLQTFVDLCKDFLGRFDKDEDGSTTCQPGSVSSSKTRLASSARKKCLKSAPLSKGVVNCYHDDNDEEEEIPLRDTAVGVVKSSKESFQRFIDAEDEGFQASISASTSSSLSSTSRRNQANDIASLKLKKKRRKKKINEDNVILESVDEESFDKTESKEEGEIHQHDVDDGENEEMANSTYLLKECSDCLKRDFGKRNEPELNGKERTMAYFHHQQQQQQERHQRQSNLSLTGSQRSSYTRMRQKSSQETCLWCNNTNNQSWDYYYDNDDDFDDVLYEELINVNDINPLMEERENAHFPYSSGKVQSVYPSFTYTHPASKRSRIRLRISSNKTLKGGRGRPHEYTYLERDDDYWRQRNSQYNEYFLYGEEEEEEDGAMEGEDCRHMCDNEDEEVEEEEEEEERMIRERRQKKKDEVERRRSIQRNERERSKNEMTKDQTQSKSIDNVDDNGRERREKEVDLKNEDKENNDLPQKRQSKSIDESEAAPSTSKTRSKNDVNNGRKIDENDDDQVNVKVKNEEVARRKSNEEDVRKRSKSTVDDGRKRSSASSKYDDGSKGRLNDDDRRRSKNDDRNDRKDRKPTRNYEQDDYYNGRRQQQQPQRNSRRDTYENVRRKRNDDDYGRVSKGKGKKRGGYNNCEICRGNFDYGPYEEEDDDDYDRGRYRGKYKKPPPQHQRPPPPPPPRIYGRPPSSGRKRYQEYDEDDGCFVPKECAKCCGPNKNYKYYEHYIISPNIDDNIDDEPDKDIDRKNEKKVVKRKEVPVKKDNSDDERLFHKRVSIEETKNIIQSVNPFENENEMNDEEIPMIINEVPPVPGEEVIETSNNQNRLCPTKTTNSFTSVLKETRTSHFAGIPDDQIDATLKDFMEGVTNNRGRIEALEKTMMNVKSCECSSNNQSATKNSSGTSECEIDDEMKKLLEKKWMSEEDRLWNKARNGSLRKDKSSSLDSSTLSHQSQTQEQTQSNTQEQTQKKGRQLGSMSNLQLNNEVAKQELMIKPESTPHVRKQGSRLSQQKLSPQVSRQGSKLNQQSIPQIDRQGFIVSRQSNPQGSTLIESNLQVPEEDDVMLKPQTSFRQARSVSQVLDDQCTLESEDGPEPEPESKELPLEEKESKPAFVGNFDLDLDHQTLAVVLEEADEDSKDTLIEDPYIYHPRAASEATIDSSIQRLANEKQSSSSFKPTQAQEDNFPLSSHPSGGSILKKSSMTTGLKHATINNDIIIEEKNEENDDKGNSITPSKKQNINPSTTIFTVSTNTKEEVKAPKKPCKDIGTETCRLTRLGMLPEDGKDACACVTDSKDASAQCRCASASLTDSSQKFVPKNVKHSFCKVTEFGECTTFEIMKAKSVSQVLRRGFLPSNVFVLRKQNK